MNGHGLNHDGISELLGEAKPGIANLTDNVRSVTDKPDLLIFAKAHFTETVGDVRGGGVMLDANGNAGFDLAQGAHVPLGALPLNDHNFFGFLFHRNTRLNVEGVACKRVLG